jgi:pyruvate/2-oxoglutarate dehydrogenase complex dihydrolipoamide dehydrogenase (E3) component
MEQINTDICIIGAGSGGLSIAAGAVQMGARVVLVEAGEMGGDCLNAGCVPSKALIAAAKQAHAMTTGAALGIAPVVPDIDFAKVKDHVAAVIAGIAPVDSQERFEGLGVRVIREWGKFTGPQELTAGNFRIKARRYVVATGSRPFVPPIPGIESVPYLTNETIFAQRERPAHLIVIGGGPIGMEMAQAHRRLGSEVTVIEGAKAFGRDDPEAAAVVLAKMRGEGVTVMEDAPVVRVGGVEGAVEVEIKDGRVVTGSHLLMAVGRKVSLDGLGLEAAGVEFTRKGVTVGPDLRSSNRKIYAVGDAAGGLQFTHVAGYHAGIVIRQMLFGLPSKSAKAHIPWATYTDPELAQVGPTEAEARKTFGDALTVARFDYAENDRAQAERKTEGFVKVMVVKGRPIGVTLVGAQAGELIGLWAMAIAARLKMAAVAGTVLPYPTLGEVSKRAAGAYFSAALFDSPMVKRVVGLVQRYLP